MTDRNWNNSELKKFSVTQSKSNADIVEELRNFQKLANETHINVTDADGAHKIQVAHVHGETDEDCHTFTDEKAES